VAAGHEVHAWNRSGGAIDGVTMVSSASELLDADLLMTMLPEDAAIRSVILDPGLLRGAHPDLIHVVL